jgi:hypothetical protein
MINRNEEEPACFGDLEIVFPKTDDGLRHSPESCIHCFHKTECLRKAMAGKGGLKVKEENTDRAYASGTIGFFERWSKKKVIRQKTVKYDHKGGKNE